MSEPNTPEEWQNAFAAEAKLAMLDALEPDLIVMNNPDTPEVWRKSFIAGYRRLLGVDPEERAAFRKGLQEISQTGSMSPEEYIKQIRRTSGTSGGSPW